MEKGAIFSNADDLQTGCAVRAERSGLQYKPHPQRKTHWRSHAPKDKKRSNAVVGDAGDYLLSTGLSAGGLDCVQPGRSRKIGGLSAKRCSCFPERKRSIWSAVFGSFGWLWIVHENKWLFEHPPGIFQEEIFFICGCGFGLARALTKCSRATERRL